jgi:hypothetical protein
MAFPDLQQGSDGSCYGLTDKAINITVLTDHQTLKDFVSPN